MWCNKHVVYIKHCRPVYSICCNILLQIWCKNETTFKILRWTKQYVAINLFYFLLQSIWNSNWRFWTNYKWLKISGLKMAKLLQYSPLIVQDSTKLLSVSSSFLDLGFYITSTSNILQINSRLILLWWFFPVRNNYTEFQKANIIYLSPSNPWELGLTSTFLICAHETAPRAQVTTAWIVPSFKRRL